jgi:hypothetical protein
LYVVPVPGFDLNVGVGDWDAGHGVSGFGDLQHGFVRPVDGWEPARRQTRLGDQPWLKAAEEAFTGAVTILLDGVSRRTDQTTTSSRRA